MKKSTTDLEVTMFFILLLFLCWLVVGLRPDTRPQTAEATGGAVITEAPVPAVQTPAPTPAPTPTPMPEPDPVCTEEQEQTPAVYDMWDVMCLANLAFHEISAICYDDSYTEEEQDLALLEWCCVALNHIDMGLADTIPELMQTTTAGGYYIWHAKFATVEYANEAAKARPEIYDRCVTAAKRALEGDRVLPSDVIYADLKAHGSGVYKSYKVDTGYYRSTVYLSYS